MNGFDIHLSTQKNLALLDFNPFAEVTDGLMFEWSELRNMESRVDNDISASNCMPDLQVCMSGLIIKGVESLIDVCINV